MRGRQGRQVMRPAPKILLAMMVATSACSSAAEAPPALPGLSLSTTAAAQTAFRPILRRWASAFTREERAAVEPELAAFVSKFPDDGKVPAAQVLRAWI